MEKKGPAETAGPFVSVMQSPARCEAGQTFICRG